MANESRFTFTLIGSDEPFRVTEFVGQETISSPFEWEITIASEDANLELKDFLNKSAVLTLLSDDPVPKQRLIHGFITTSSYLSTGERFSLYKVTLTPQFSYFKFRSGYRIFQDMTVQDIIKRMFAYAKIPRDQIQWKLKQSYARKDYCVQHGETEFEFISRLLAEEGIHYHFTHHLDRHVIVFSDSNTAFDTSSNNATLPYRQEQSRAHGETSAHQFTLIQKVSTHKSQLIDFTFTSPKNTLIANSGTGERQITSYPGNISTEPARTLRQTNCQYSAFTASTVKRIRHCHYQRFASVRHPVHPNERSKQTLEPKLPDFLYAP